MTPAETAARDLAEHEDTWWLYTGQEQHWRDLYVRAFLAGARWQEDEVQRVFNRILDRRDLTSNGPARAAYDFVIEKLSDLLTRVEPLTNSPTPSAGSTASPDTGERPLRGKA